jgi:hypothetical protein
MRKDSGAFEAPSVFQAAGAVVQRTAGRARRLICGLNGHDTLLHFDHGRMSLVCTSCGYESPGWKFAAGAESKSGSPGRPAVGPRAA